MEEQEQITDEEKSLQIVLENIKEQKNLTETLENEILCYFDSKGEKIVNILKKQELFKLKLNEKLYLWEVKGRNKSYLIIDSSFCECTDFAIRVIQKGERKYCYHVLAKIIGEQMQLYKEYTISIAEYEKKIKKGIEEIKT